jgi:hypothetical protein
VLGNAETLYAVFDFRSIDTTTGKPIPRTPRAWRDTAEQNALDVDFDHCLTGRLFETPASATVSSLQLPNGERIETRAVRGFFLCRASYAPELLREIPLDPMREALFDRIEETCPHMYFPKHVKTSCSTGFCARAYHGTDSHITIDDHGEVRSGRFGAIDTAYWGTVPSLLSAASPIDCHDSVGKYVPWSPGENMFPGMKR